MSTPAWKRLGLKLKPSSAPEPSPVAKPTTKRTLDEAPSPALKKKPKSDPPKAAPAAKQKKPAKKQPPANITPALEYLRQWRSARSSWKFNKNHQGTLIKHVFDPDVFPGRDVGAFCAYIQDLKGFTRQRLREAAAEEEARNTDDIKVGELVAQLRGKTWDEGQWRASSGEEGDVVARVVRRMRARMVLDELEETTPAPKSSSSSEAAAAAAAAAVTKNDNAGRRRRKLRVNEDSDSSDSDTSSSGSSDDSSDEDTS